jgi:hypothetical protein
MQSWQMACVLTALSAVLVVGAGCASRQQQPAPIQEPAGIERPAQPLSEEESLSDRIGEVGIVILVIGVTVGLIVVPLLFL